MNQLEEFLHQLNSISTSEVAATLRHHNLAEYLLNGHGWQVLTHLYTKQIQVNLNSQTNKKIYIFLDLLIQVE